jgi:hypothetical protein
MIQLGIVEAVEQVNGSRSRSCHADADLAGVLGVGAGHKRCLFLVPHLHKLELLLLLLKCTKNTIDTITGIAINKLDVPQRETL